MGLVEDMKVLRYTLGRYKEFKKQKDYITWFYDERPGLFKFKDIHKGEDCFILGNGPSLNKMDLIKLNDYYTFGLNKIFLIFKKVDLRLSYHVSVNKYVIEQSKDELLNLKCPKFLSYKGSNHILQYRDFYYLYTNGGVGGFQPNITNPLIECGTVTYVAMQVAYYMGFQNVFLIGVDHNFKQSGRANEEQVMAGPDLNHFDPNYFTGQKWNLADLKSSEFGYNQAKLWFEMNNRHIMDSTLEGKLSIFKKLDFVEALKIAKKKNKTETN